MMIEEIKRSKPKSMIIFPKAFVSKDGHQLIAYEWAWMGGLRFDAYDGGDVECRVSDWDNAVKNPETGRMIVHQFHVVVDGEIKVVSLESAQQIMGIKNLLNKVRAEINRAFIRDMIVRCHEARKPFIENYLKDNFFPKTRRRLNVSGAKEFFVAYDAIYAGFGKKPMNRMDEVVYGEYMVTDREITMMIKKHGEMFKAQMEIISRFEK